MRNTSQYNLPKCLSKRIKGMSSSRIMCRLRGYALTRNPRTVRRFVSIDSQYFVQCPATEIQLKKPVHIYTSIYKYRKYITKKCSLFSKCSLALTIPGRGTSPSKVPSNISIFKRSTNLHRISYFLTLAISL